MSITIEQIREIKDKAEQRRRSVERAHGRLDQLMKALKDEFDCSTIEEAKEKLAELQTKGETIGSKIEKLKIRVTDLWENVEHPDKPQEQE